MKTENKFGSLRFKVSGAIDYVPLSENPNHHPKKKKAVQPEDAFKDTAFKPGFEIVKL